MNFIKSMYDAYLNDRIVNLYETENGAALVVERREHSETYRPLKFKSIKDAQAWYDRQSGSGLARMESAIDEILEIGRARERWEERTGRVWEEAFGVWGEI